MTEPVNLPVAVPERVTKVLAILVRCANAGTICPGNEDLRVAIGAPSVSAPANAISLLEDLGVIDVRRYQRGRQVTIMSSGKSTAAISGTEITARKSKPRNGSTELSREQIDQFADELSESGSVTTASRALGISTTEGYKILAVLKSELGAQAA